MKKFILIILSALLCGCSMDADAYNTIIQNGKEVFVNQASAIRQILIDHRDTIEMLREQFGLPPFTRESIPEYIKIAVMLAPHNYKVKALLLVLEKLGVV